MKWEILFVCLTLLIHSWGMRNLLVKDLGKSFQIRVPEYIR